MNMGFVVYFLLRCYLLCGMFKTMSEDKVLEFILVTLLFYLMFYFR